MEPAVALLVLLIDVLRVRLDHELVIALIALGEDPGGELKISLPQKLLFFLAVDLGIRFVDDEKIRLLPQQDDQRGKQRSKKQYSNNNRYRHTESIQCWDESKTRIPGGNGGIDRYGQCGFAAVPEKAAMERLCIQTIAPLRKLPSLYIPK